MNYSKRLFHRLIICLFLSLFGLMVVSCAYKTPRTPGHLVRYGIELAEAGYWKEARRQWEMVLSEDPENVAALNNLAVVSELFTDFAAAQELLVKASAIKPKDARIKHNINALQKRIDDQTGQEKTDEKTKKQ